ncbi:hypothetical protein [Oryza sativa Japonica Group]|uniref:Uncharacterized protein n=1 Tax=Oryza sativa subsp. japonica TaxID=39947 RepID=Q5QM93_ORYSJ|nr:hypothetical protein [Oryza sativa Japonica Group]BAD73742.1 hypothetical protein [Oryza sativa Japonica Group]
MIFDCLRRGQEEGYEQCSQKRQERTQESPCRIMACSVHSYLEAAAADAKDWAVCKLQSTE